MSSKITSEYRPVVAGRAWLCSRRVGRKVPAIPAKGMDALKRCSCPGNTRELQSVIERAVILSGSSLVLPPQDVQPTARRAASSAKPATTFHDAERDAIVHVLRESKRRHRREERRRRTPWAQPDHAALEDAAAGHSAAVVPEAAVRGPRSVVRGPWSAVGGQRSAVRGPQVGGQLNPSFPHNTS